LGSAIINDELFNVDSDNNLNFIGIFAKNRLDWSVVDLAGILYKIVTVPIYDTLGDENISYVLRHVAMKTIFVDNTSLKSLKKTQDLDKLQWIVSFDPLDQESIEYFASKEIKLISYCDLLAKGKEKLVDYNDPKFNVQPEDCCTFSYTSGTTGPPKGAMMSHKNFASVCTASQINKDLKANSSDVILSYLPLPHILERSFLYILWSVGGSVVYFSGDITKIKDDLALVRPTVFASVPRLFTRFYDVMQAKFK
jgi:long-chain acyl-CoA synthetase